MSQSKRQPDALTHVLSGQMSLFAAYSPPTFDEMCPPPAEPQEQLGLDVTAAPRVRQMSTYDYDC